MEKIKELRADIESKLSAARSIDATGTRAQIHVASEAVRVAKEKLSETITAGAKPCPTCGAAPHGMVHDVAVRKAVMPVFEVGCLVCKDHRAQGFTPDLATAAWNAGPKAWLPPSDGPGVKTE